MSGTFEDRLRRARRRRFVGRAGEIELFRVALGAGAGAAAEGGDEAESPFSVLFMYGPGGVGKSALLAELADEARRCGAAPVVVDARVVEPSPEAFVQAAGESTGRRVVMIDTYELLAPLDDWVRETFLPGLPSDALVVIAGRDAPSPRWTADPGWRELLRVVSLRNLRPEDTRAYLRVEGVPDELHEQVLAMTHGHPLALSLTVDMIVRQRREGRAVPDALAAAPDVVRALLGRVIDQVPSPRHARALQVCAHARFTTEELLRAMLDGRAELDGNAMPAAGDDAGELFGWLRTLSFMEEGAHGLFPHDVARDILDADLRWRDPDGYAALHRRLRGHLVERVRRATGNRRDHRKHVADVLFLSRSHPVVSSYWQLTGLGGFFTDGVRPDDHAALLDLTRRVQGEEQAALAAYWLGRRPDAFGAFRDTSGELFGYAAFLPLHEADERDLAADPAARAMWEYTERHGPARPGESVMAWRFFVDAEAHIRPSRAETLIRLWTGQDILTSGPRAWDLVAVPSDRGYWDPLLRHFDFHHAARFGVGGRPYEVYAHDWRRLSVEEWLELTAERELGAAATPPTGTAPELVLSQPEFADAVRAALKDLHRPERLAGNPLMRSRLVRHRAGTLPDLITEAAGTLRGDESLYRVVDRTFLRPAATQERAAEMLGLPFSTYRRHRDRAVDRITAWLWQREIHGATETG
ncbi:ATP-binding protein [Actinomadura sp. 9N215]|uniref:ATP-binding protein n=1 Tax=Actinomadura sp. 9N215 TaxID=3375150 RepID=UPI0037AD0231